MATSFNNGIGHLDMFYAPYYNREPLKFLEKKKHECLIGLEEMAILLQICQ